MRTILLASLLVLVGCSSGLHSVYVGGADQVFLEDESGKRIECFKAYSSWDGAFWEDFYGKPCNVFVKYKAREIKINAKPPSGLGY